MSFPQLFQTIHQSPTLLTIVGIMELISSIGMHHLCQFAKFAPLDIPDVWFGYTSHEFYSWLERIGPEGRNAYLHIMKWDFCPYMPSYMLLLGSVLCKVWESNSTTVGRKNTNEKEETEVSSSPWLSWWCHSWVIAWIAPLIMTFDVVETGLNYYLTVQFPQQQFEMVVMLSSLANQIKWILAGIAIVQLVLWLLFKYQPTNPWKRKWL